jgi:hypothetical protein
MDNNYESLIQNEIKLISDYIFELSENISILESQYNRQNSADIHSLIRDYIYEDYFELYQKLLTLYRLRLSTMSENVSSLSSLEKIIQKTSYLLIHFEDNFQ